MTETMFVIDCTEQPDKTWVVQDGKWLFYVSIPYYTEHGEPDLTPRQAAVVRQRIAIKLLRQREGRDPNWPP